MPMPPKQNNHQGRNPREQHIISWGISPYNPKSPRHSVLAGWKAGIFFLGPAELEVLVTVVDHDGTIPDGNRSLGSAERSVPARGPGWVLWGFSQPSHRILREIISGVQLSVSFQSDGCGAQALALIFANCGE